jgi:hypothetical protein
MKYIYIYTMILLALTLTFGCSKQEIIKPEVDAQVVELTVSQVISNSGEYMTTLTSFRFKMTHEIGATEFLPGLDVEEVSGDVQPPDLLEAEFIGMFGAFPIRSMLVAIGKDNYLTNPLTGVWEQIEPTVNLGGFFNSSEGMASLLEKMTDSKFLTDQTLDSSNYEIRGELATAYLGSLLGETLEAENVVVEATISKTNFALSKIKFIGKAKESDIDGTIRLVTMSKFNVPVEIEVPSVADAE